MLKGACGLCGKDPAEGLASISLGGGPEVYYCHGDNDEVSCYERASRHQGDVVGFLLARIAEDRERARDERSPQFRHIVWSADLGTTVEDHILADCEAKRRIVERYMWAVEHPEYDMELMDQWSDAMDTLDDLASVYGRQADTENDWDAEPTKYMIVSYDDGRVLYWSDGWREDKAQGDVFTHEERHHLNLPLDGEWIEMTEA